MSCARAGGAQQFAVLIFIFSVVLCRACFAMQSLVTGNDSEQRESVLYLPHKIDALLPN